MKLELTKAAQKGLSKMPAKARVALVGKLSMVAASPFIKHPFDVKAMKGAPDTFRLRQGDWRAVYRVVRVEDTLMVLIIDVRGEVYE
ncbi:MAG: type II toxin-antitoxin system RelE family toxin [Niveispirillum sp.]|uniref:type II toxin-antitoxin system RelE family toxin n=1 Tax=Niveispirillum sp. TaxID=1917217 RepID=UPI003BA7B652